MTDRPIIFSASMVKALLEGRKSQTRRILKPQPVSLPGRVTAPAQDDDGIWGQTITEWRWSDSLGNYEPERETFQPLRLRYAIGDRLWVRETHSLHHAHGHGRSDGLRWGPWGGLPTTVSADGTQIAYYREGFDRCGHGRWRSPIHMPRWASRLTLTVTDVRVERLQEISEADAFDEGVTRADVPLATWRASYRTIWNSLHGPHAWADNPWVAAISFTVARRTIEAGGDA